jgi:hypothetical protein
MKRLCLFTCVLALATFVSTGCEPAKKTAKAPVAEKGDDLLEGFQQLSDAYTGIKAAMEKSDMDAAHDPLHDLAHLLGEDLPKLTKKSSLDDDTKTKLAAHWNTLMDEFGKLDAFFHNGPKADWAELDKKIAPVMEELKGLVK